MIRRWYQVLQLGFALPPQIDIGLRRVAGPRRIYSCGCPVPISDVAFCRQRNRCRLGAFFTIRLPFWKTQSPGLTHLPLILDSRWCSAIEVLRLPSRSLRLQTQPVATDAPIEPPAPQNIIPTAALRQKHNHVNSALQTHLC